MENSKTVETYQYDRQTIQKALGIINQLADAAGIAKARILCTLFDILDRPLKEDVLHTDSQNIEENE